VLGAGLGFIISLGTGYAFGSEDPWGDALESLDPFDPSTMGDAELTPERIEEMAYLSMQEYQQELDAQAALLPTDIGTLAREAQCSGKQPSGGRSPSNPSRSTLLP
jgi:hypothetical protein